MFCSFKTLLFIILLGVAPLRAFSLVEIKGVMLQRIGSFISWPQLPEKAMRVCIVDDDGFARNLQKLYRNKELHALPLEVISQNSNVDIQTLLSCQIIYIADTDKNVVNKIAKMLKNHTALIIGSDSDNIYEGASVVLYLDSDKYKIIINEKSLAESQLRADYRLLKLAKIVEHDGADYETK